MALDQNAKYPVGTIPPTAAYPEGSAVNSTAPGALDGYPLEKDQLNDRFGLEQALLKSSGQAASGVPDTALASQYLQGIIELAQGRATNYDDSGVADAYVLDVQTDQQAPSKLFDGQIFEFIVGNTNTGASTVNPVGTGIKNIVNTTAAGALTAGIRARIKYRLGTTDFEILNPSISSQIRLNTANGYGSTNTKIRRFTNIVTNQGTDITYADSATLGASFTINTSGFYAISYTDVFNNPDSVGLSLNSSELTTNIQSLVTIADALAWMSTANTNFGGDVAWSGYLSAGDVIRPHCGAGVTGTGLQLFNIGRVA